jgi:hypothetical protein
MHRSLRHLAVALAAFGLAACTPALTVNGQWNEGGRAVAPFRNILVVGVSQSFDRRKFFEDAAAATLRDAGTVALASTARMTTKDALDRERVRALVGETGADAVLVTRIVHQDVAMRAERGSIGARPDATVDLRNRYDPSVYTLYRYDFSVGVAPDRLIVDRTVAVRTEVFAVSSGLVAYAIDSRVQLSELESRSFGSDAAVLDRVGRALAARLIRDGVVAKR